jgi:hypothetical protein
MTIPIKTSCFWNYYGKCDKPECTDCRSFKPLYEVIGRGREAEKTRREGRLAQRILDFRRDDEE